MEAISQPTTTPVTNHSAMFTPKQEAGSIGGSDARPAIGVGLLPIFLPAAIGDNDIRLPNPLTLPHDVANLRRIEALGSPP